MPKMSVAVVVALLLTVATFPHCVEASILTDDVDIDGLLGAANDVVVTAGMEFTASGDPPIGGMGGTVVETLDVTENGFVWSVQATRGPVNMWQRGETLLTISDIAFVGMPLQQIVGVILVHTNSPGLVPIAVDIGALTSDSITLTGRFTTTMRAGEFRTVTGTFQTAEVSAPVPEPMSMLVWGGIATVGGLFTWRRCNS